MAGTFELQLRAIAARAKDRANEVVRKVLFDVSAELVEKSPVGDGKYWKNPPPKGYVGGRFRANWQFAEGSIDRSTGLNVDPGGEATVSRLAAEIPEQAAGKVFYITNSLPYAKRIEDGWSYRQAPLGIVGITFVEWRDFLNKALQETSK